MKMDPLARLTAIAEIQALKARYFRLLDAHEWEGLAELFLPDAIISVPLWTEPRTTPAAIRFFQEHMTPIESVHHGFMPEISVSGAADAVAIWRMEDRLYRPTGTPGVWALTHGFGTYVDEYRAVQGIWRYSAMTLTRSRQDFYPAVRKADQH